MASELFPFRYFDPMRGRWIQARYKASRDDIAARGGEITGPGYIPSAVGEGKCGELATPDPLGASWSHPKPHLGGWE